MDRRQLKTRRAILKAFRGLLEKKRYDRITVQEIIDAADVGRSTFYAHFEARELLLDELCKELFYHIFQYDPCPYEDKDDNLESKLSHTLWHIREERDNISAVLVGDSGEMFMSYFKEHSREVFETFISKDMYEVPRDFVLNHLVGSFAETVKWWINEEMKTPPETVAHYFLSMTEKHKYNN